MVAMAKSDRATLAGTIPARRTVGSPPPPAWIKPQLAKLVEKAPDGPDWLHEIKFDGYRMHARLDAGSVQILTRRGNNWTDKYPAIAKAVAGRPARMLTTCDRPPPTHSLAGSPMRIAGGDSHRGRGPSLVARQMRQPATPETCTPCTRGIDFRTSKTGISNATRTAQLGRRS
jgi:hypothetical protein